jgi:hypothetical protein
MGQQVLRALSEAVGVEVVVVLALTEVRAASAAMVEVVEKEQQVLVVMVMVVLQLAEQVLPEGVLVLVIEEVLLQEELLEELLVLFTRLEVAKFIKDNVVVSKRDLLHVLLEVVEGKREIQLML